MRILAVETATNVASVAIIENDIILGEYSCNKGKTHSQRLMPMVSHLLETTGLSAADFDAYAASVGPGSFTGLRIGVTTVKAMAYAAQKPVISVHTLDALAYNLPVSHDLICPVLDARNDQVFTTVYRFREGKLERLTDYLGIHVSELVEIIKPMEGNVSFLGDACKLHSGFFAEQLGSRVVPVPGNSSFPRAASVALRAYDLYLQGEQESCFDAVPFYLRKSQAEREKENGR